MVNRFVGLAVFVFLYAGCSTGGMSPSQLNPKPSKDLTSHVANPEDLRGINSVLVVPLELKGKLGLSDAGTYPFYEELLASFSDEAGIEVRGGRDLFSIQRAPSGVRVKEEALSLAKKAKADAVLLTELLTIVERDGSSVGVNTPASAGFFMVMIDTKTGEERWRASYHVTDRALIDNLLAVKESSERGARWRTASELIERGFLLAARDFGSRRRSQFLS